MYSELLHSPQCCQTRNSIVRAFLCIFLFVFVFSCRKQGPVRAVALLLHIMKKFERMFCSLCFKEVLFCRTRLCYDAYLSCNLLAQVIFHVQLTKLYTKRVIYIEKTPLRFLTVIQTQTTGYQYCPHYICVFIGKSILFHSVENITLKSQVSYYAVIDLC